VSEILLNTQKNKRKVLEVLLVLLLSPNIIYISVILIQLGSNHQLLDFFLLITQ
jgi:hypothetical protein